MQASTRKQFLDSVRSPFTKRNYTAAINTYMQFHKMDGDWNQLLGEDIKQVQSKIQAFIIHQRDNRKLRAATIDQQISALWHFYTYNDVVGINWVRLRSYTGEHVKAVRDKPYTVEQIRTMLMHSNPRMKVILSSSIS